MDFTEIAKRKKPRQRSVEILLDEELLYRRDDLYAEIRRCQMAESLDGGDMKSPLPGLQQQLLDLKDEIEKETRTFKFESFSKDDWDAAVEKYGDDDGVLSKGFEIYIIAKSAVDPKMTQKQVKAMFRSKDWSAAETDQMFDAAYKVNREVRNTLFTQAGISEMLTSGLSSTTASLEE